MPLDPVSLGVAAVSTGLGFFQSQTQDAARRQDYLNQRAYQDASAEFNQWQAGFNAKASNVNSQYNYWSQQVNWGQEMAYVSQMRNYDLAMEIAQAEKVGEARVGAGVNYAINSEALQARLAEEGMQRAFAMQQYQYRVLQQSSAFRASLNEGQSSDRIVNDFARQAGDYATLQQINQDLSERQYTRNQLAQVTEYLNQYNSQDFFEAQQRFDPIMPYPPLPALLNPPGPTMTGAAPASTPGLNFATAALGGVNTYLGTAAQIKQL